jgi:hypothetical protein
MATPLGAVPPTLAEQCEFFVEIDLLHRNYLAIALILA